MQLCATRGERPPSTKPPRQQKREIQFALARRNGSVFLVQRPGDASLMAGMWELPEVSAPSKGKHHRNGNGKENRKSALLFKVRHSITVTDYTVQVWHSTSPDAAGEWIPLRRLPKLALTGLARKILRRAEILS